MQAILTLVPLLVLLSGAFTEAGAQAEAHPKRQGGTVVQPWEGEQLKFCHAPELTAVLKVDSATAGATRFSMGTGGVAPRSSNGGRHAGVEEITYFVRGRGWGVVGTDTVPIHPGTTMYVPEGVYHAFINPTDEEMEFVWVVAPRGLEDSFRARGVPPGTPCPPTAPR